MQGHCRVAGVTWHVRVRRALCPENRVDLAALRDLTDQDLKELGVFLGDRRKILRAISELEVPVARPGRSRGQSDASSP